MHPAGLWVSLTLLHCLRVSPTRPPRPPELALGPGGVLLHRASGRPVPHACSIGPHGGLISSDGRPLPDSMSVGANW